LVGKSLNELRDFPASHVWLPEDIINIHKWQDQQVYFPLRLYQILNL
jgi:hypothetical protein